VPSAEHETGPPGHDIPGIPATHAARLSNIAHAAAPDRGPQSRARLGPIVTDEATGATRQHDAEWPRSVHNGQLLPTGTRAGFQMTAGTATYGCDPIYR
jgi:hypothetical protein